MFYQQEQILLQGRMENKMRLGAVRRCGSLIKMCHLGPRKQKQKKEMKWQNVILAVKEAGSWKCTLAKTQFHRSCQTLKWTQRRGEP